MSKTKKFFTFTLSLFLLLFLCGCSEISSYDDGYDDGYMSGYKDGKSEIDSDSLDDARDAGFSEGYDFGYEEGYWDKSNDLSDDIRDVFSDAEAYASKNSEWCPEEARSIVDAYLNNEPLYDNQVPSKAEYQEAVEILWRFYEYFYSAHYE